MNEHDQQQNHASRSQGTNIVTNKLPDDSDPILGIEVAVCPPQLQDDILTAHSKRHAKKQCLVGEDDVQSKITYINVGTNVTYGSRHAMTMSPGLDGGFDDDISSKGTASTRRCFHPSITQFPWSVHQQPYHSTLI
jgi:hypothetical protein